MSAQIKEALAALDTVDVGLREFMPDVALAMLQATIRAALEAAAQEAEAWEAIEAWCRAAHGRTYALDYAGPSRMLPARWCFQFQACGTNKTGPVASEGIFGVTRLEALTKAAAWCRAQGAT